MLVVASKTKKPKVAQWSRTSGIKRCFAMGHKLIDTKSVAAVGDSEWLVEGQIVLRTLNAEIKCSCHEYRRKKVCPHFAAVALVLSQRAEFPEG